MELEASQKHSWRCGCQGISRQDQRWVLKQGEKGKGQTACKHQGRQLELWFAEDPGARGEGAELGHLSTNSCHPLFTDLICSQGTSVSLYWPHPCGHRFVRCSILQPSGSQHVPCKHRGAWLNSCEGPGATWDMPMGLWSGRKVAYECTHTCTQLHTRVCSMRCQE